VLLTTDLDRPALRSKLSRAANTTNCTGFSLIRLARHLWFSIEHVRDMTDY